MGNPANIETLNRRIAALEAAVAEGERETAALRESEYRCRAVVSSLKEGIILQEASGRILTWNPSAERIFGITAADAIGRTSLDTDWPTITPDGRKMEGKDHPSMITLATGRPCHDVLMGIRRAPDDTRWISVNTQPIFEEGKSTPAAVAISFSECTERLAEKAELEREAVRRRILIEQSRDGIVVLDDGGKIFEVNKKFADMLGYTIDEARELCVWDWENVLPRETVVEMLKTVDAAGDHFETEHRRKDGSTYPVEISTNGAVFDGRKMVFCVCRDITERKAAEEVLRASEQRLQALSDASFEAIFFSDRGICIDQNQTARKMFGYSDEAAIGRPGTDWIAPADREAVKARMMVADERPYEVTALRADGTTFPAEIQGRVFTYQGRHIRVTALRDITDRRRAEEALRESEERFRRLFEDAPIAIQGYQPDGTIRYWNKASVATYGYTKEEAIGSNLVDLIIPPEMRDEVMGVIRTGADTGQMPPTEELALMKKDGSRVSVLSSHVAIGRPGKEMELYCIDSDLTELKHLQAELAQVHKMQAIGTLTGGIAHDFNNILGVIIGNCELALEDVPEWNPAHNNLEEIRTAGLRAKDIVRQLLTFCRKGGHERKPTHLVPVLQGVVKFIRAAIPTTIDIRCDFRATADTILSEPSLIYQVLMNLCSNAARAMADSGGRILIGVENILREPGQQGIALSGLPPGRYIQLTVEDTGPGIDSEIIDRVFDPYFTTAEVGEGSGMGLAVVQGIVNYHKGRISVASRPGAGATFTVLLPLVDEVPEPARPDPGAPPTGSESILLVDDERGVAVMQKKQLLRLGYTVHVETDPRQAIAVFREDPLRFDLVLTDMTMPAMNGLDLARQIKTIRPGMPVILCTGHSEQVTPEKLATIGIEVYLMKPVSKSDMAKGVRRALDAGASDTAP